MKKYFVFRSSDNKEIFCGSFVSFDSAMRCVHNDASLTYESVFHIYFSDDFIRVRYVDNKFLMD